MKGILVGMMIGLNSTSIGRCCGFGMGLQTIFLQFGDILSDTKHRSGLYVFFHRLLVKDLGSFGSFMSCILLFSAQRSIASPPELV